ncbi:MAG TPA: metallophosphoesterase [Desulfobacteraceae bacterium]|nr:metallophosphoesterase family protein [Deltaproteobacteria bacterium]MBW2355630.1 metallophosphoesterase family protein [Deltaproteobacteria bacterium]RLB97822.1 MAG: metallophosphoesterase [Deltaproteobacteria bacterium]HDI59530.1 metallophosphoesterase [Desulfobacteraceae bacterium]
MRIAVISDIHGNLDALTAVLDDLETCAVDHLVCLGDCVGYGAEPEAVLRRIAALGCPTVMGNHEAAALDPGVLDWFNAAARRSMEMTLGLLSARSLRFIADLPETVEKWEARFVHGFPPDSVWRYLFQVSAQEIDEWFAVMPERICFVGHTHRLELVGGDGVRRFRSGLSPGPTLLDPGLRHIVNVGSVGQPRDGTPEAKYVIWEPRPHRLVCRSVPYPYGSAADKILRAGMPETHALRLLPASWQESWR